MSCKTANGLTYHLSDKTGDKNKCTCDRTLEWSDLLSVCWDWYRFMSDITILFVKVANFSWMDAFIRNYAQFLLDTVLSHACWSNGGSLVEKWKNRKRSGATASGEKPHEKSEKEKTCDLCDVYAISTEQYYFKIVLFDLLPSQQAHTKQ